MSPHSGGDPKEFGSIYHAMVAWACSNPGILDDERAISDFLSRQASPLAFDAEALRISLKARFSWISSTWPGSELCAEYPVSARLDGSSNGKVEEIVATWAPQLALYATAIARVSGKPPVRTLLNLPLEGSAVRVIGAE